MDGNLPHYLTGGAVHAGDRVRYRGESGRIVVVSDGEGGEFLTGYSDRHGCDAGVMFCSDEGQSTFFSEPTEELELVSRSEKPPTGSCMPPASFPENGRPPMKW